MCMGAKQMSFWERWRFKREEMFDSLHNAFYLAFTKFSKHWDTHPAKEVYRLIRILILDRLQPWKCRFKPTHTCTPWQTHQQSLVNNGLPISTVCPESPLHLVWILMNTGGAVDLYCLYPHCIGTFLLFPSLIFSVWYCFVYSLLNVVCLNLYPLPPTLKVPSLPSCQDFIVNKKVVLKCPARLNKGLIKKQKALSVFNWDVCERWKAWHGQTHRPSLSSSSISFACIATTQLCL